MKIKTNVISLIKKKKNHSKKKRKEWKKITHKQLRKKKYENLNNFYFLIGKKKCHAGLNLKQKLNWSLQKVSIKKKWGKNNLHWLHEVR